MDGIADTIRVLRRFNLFWAVFTSVTLAFCTVVAVNNHPTIFQSIQFAYQEKGTSLVHLSILLHQ